MTVSLSRSLSLSLSLSLSFSLSLPLPDLSVVPAGSGLAIGPFATSISVRDIRLTGGVMAGQREINANFPGNRLPGVS